MRAGILTEQIALQQPSVTYGNYNEEDVTYVTYRLTRAYVDHKNGNKIEVTDENFWTDIRTFTIRIYHDIQPTYRIIYHMEPYRILDIDIDREKQCMIIKAEKVNE